MRATRLLCLIDEMGVLKWTLGKMKINMVVMEKWTQKIVTRRRGRPDPIAEARIFLQTVSQLQGGRLIPRGLYHFKTHEEADQWLIQTLAKNKK